MPRAIAAVAEQKDQDKATEDKVGKRAGEKHAFLSSFAAAYFTHAQVPDLPSMSWSAVDATGITIAITGGMIEAYWTTVFYEYAVQGQLVNRAAILGPIHGKMTSTVYVPDEISAKEGYLILSEDLQHISIMAVEQDEPLYLQWHSSVKKSSDQIANDAQILARAFHILSAYG